MRSPCTSSSSDSPPDIRKAPARRAPQIVHHILGKPSTAAECTLFVHERRSARLDAVDGLLDEEPILEPVTHDPGNMPILSVNVGHEVGLAFFIGPDGEVRHMYGDCSWQGERFCGASMHFSFYSGDGPDRPIVECIFSELGYLFNPDTAGAKGADGIVE
jgi:hypothetical protein